MELRPPNHLSLTGSAKNNFKRFKQEFELYWEATAHLKREEKQKVALFLHVAGPEAIEVYNSFKIVECTYAALISKFEAYATPKLNETYERYIFRNRMQKEGESIEQYVVDLKIKAQSCNFGEIESSLIRDQVVVGVADKKMRERMLREDNLTLENAIKICQAMEQTNVQLTSLESGGRSSDSVNAIVRKRAFQQRNEKSIRQDRPKGRNGYENSRCSRCNTVHRYGQCPAYRKQCKRCKRLNHFEVCCKTQVPYKKPKVHTINETESDDDFVISLIDEISTSGKQWLLSARIDNTNITFKIDTGAQVNLIPYDCYLKLDNKYKMLKDTPTLRAYSGDNIKTFGVIKAKLQYKNEETECLMVIVENGRQPILGLETSEKLGVIKRVYEVQMDKEFGKEQILAQYKKLFTGLGKVKQEHSIRLKENSVPVIQASRRIPLSLRERLHQELDRMVSLGIIEKIDEPTDWVSSLVIVEKKNGSLRICLDPKNLNDNIMREHYSIPTRNEIEADLAGAKYFSKLDANSGFYQIPLDKKSSRLCTFNTPFGRYCFLRVPFGIKSATEIYHKTAAQLYEGIKNVKVYIDDILVYGRTKKEHDDTLRQVLDRTLEAGLTFNLEKCEFCKTEILFMGDKLTQKGMTINPENVEAILKLPIPKTKVEVQRILGMVNYVGKYIPNLSDKTKNLRNLIKKDTEMRWNHEHDEELKVLKNILTQDPVLCFFDPNRKTKISSDASQGGIGSVLLQEYEGDWKPVAYASRSLTSCETRYSQIEKETLGLLFGCEKFNDFVYGRQIILETDHKPLITLQKRCLADVPLRLQRLFIRLLKYQFEIVYVSGKKLVIADTLSRAYIQGNSKNELEELVQVHVDFVMKTLSITEEMKEKFKEETERDECLKMVREQIYEGWTDKYSVNSYQPYKDELTIVDGLIMKGNRIVVPKSLREDMLKRIHEGHLGIEKCKRRARQILFWPLMNSDIEKTVKQCDTCQKFQYRQQKEPLIQRGSGIPWDCVGTDLYYFAGKHYLVVYDSYSNYPEVEEVCNLSGKTTVNALKKIFARHGIPREVYSDNGTHYDNTEMRDFSRKYDFKLITSSPHYPRSNGLSEKGVQVVKRLLKKAKDSGDEFELGLLNYRNSPLENGKSPAELLMNRALRTRLPVFTYQGNCHKKSIRNWGGKILEPLQRGDIVRVHDGKDWQEKAKVLQEVAPRSYKVLTESNRVLRRNRQHLRKVEGQLELVLEEDNLPRLQVNERETQVKVLQQEPLEGHRKESFEQQVTERVLQTTNKTTDMKVKSEVSGESNIELRRSTRKRKAPDRLNL